MCSTVQEQTAPYHSYDPEYIFSDQGSYFKPQEEYLNDTSKVGATFNLSCYFEGMITMKYKIDTYLYPSTILDETINLENHSVKSIVIECKYDPFKNEVYWSWINQITEVEDRKLPNCMKQCKEKPFSRSDLKRHWPKRTVKSQLKTYEGFLKNGFIVTEMGWFRSEILVQ